VYYKIRDRNKINMFISLSVGYCFIWYRCGL